jgi:putative membrane protein
MDRKLIAAVAVIVAFCVPTAVALAHPHASAQDRQWLKTSIQGDRFEIRGGRLALHKASNHKVRHLAHVLIRDHSDSLAKAKRIARRFDVTIPADPTPSMEWELHQLSTFGGHKFAYRYTDLEVKDHHQDIDESSAEVEHGTAHAMVADAREEIPVLRFHLRLSKRARAAVSH